jgi:hypothetical protein
VVLIVGVLATLVVPACSSSPTRDAKAFCSAYVAVARRATKLADPDEVPLPSLRKQVGDIASAAADAADLAPEDIADTVDEVIEPLHTLRAALDDADGRAAADRALAGFRADATKLAGAQKRLDGWATANCGVVAVTSTTTPVTVHPGITG